MEKYVFYETNKSVGIVDRYNRHKYVYEKNIVPIRMVLVDVSEQGIQALMELFKENGEEFIDEVKFELNENKFTSYSN